MNAERLLAHYERIADAPDGVRKLRRFVLDLAVRGKLVPQDAGDEPASELLKRIEEEKARLTRAGKFQEPSSFVRLHRTAMPFTPAPHWTWARLIDIARPSYGFAFPSSQFNSEKRGKPLIRIRDISSTETEVFFEGEYDFAYLVTTGDYLVGMDGGFNLRQWRGSDGLLNQRVMRINEWRCGINSEFIKLPLQFILEYLHGQTSQTTVKHLSAKQVNGLEIPIPPLAEQHRIVAKVGELMALCDRLETARSAREVARDRLVAVSLARLTTPDPNSFQSDARFALNVLPAFTARPDQIKALRHTILNLAVRGKLAPQDVDDEPASELLKRIANEKRRSRHGTVSIKPEDEPYVLPEMWKWAALDQLLVSGPQNGISPNPTKRDDAPKAITLTATTSGTFNPIYFKHVEANIPVESEFWLKDGDLLFQRGNTREYVGMAAIYRGPPNTFLFPDLIMKVRVSENISLSYAHLASISPPARDFLSMNASGAQATMPKINQTTLVSLPIPLPPLAEQHRIIAKVGTLMALCDRLEASLEARAIGRSRLLDAVLAEALMPAGREPLAAE